MTLIQYEILVYSVMVVTIGSFTIYFRSVWVKGGYEGPDKILDLFEVNRVWIHVIGFIFVLIFEVMTFSQREYSPFAWSGVLTVIGGVGASEVYTDIKKTINQIKYDKETKTEEAKRH